MKILFLILFCLPLEAATYLFEPLPTSVPIPADNPQTHDKIVLGSQLFFDPRISKNGQVSCTTCHSIAGSGENNLAYSTKPNGKHSLHTVPTVWNAAFLNRLFWYGSAGSLEEQAEGPLEEMGLGSLDEITKRVAAIPQYAATFATIFPGEPIKMANITKVIASYERTLITPNSPYDRFLRGDIHAISGDAVKGMAIFETIGCISCHSGPMLDGGSRFEKFPQFPGSPYDAKYHLNEDPGRFNETNQESDRGFWRVAPLRNIALTAPYFHNGSVTTLEEAVTVMAKTQLNRELTDVEVHELVSFLGSLTGEFGERKLPRLPDLPSLNDFPAVAP